MLVALCCVSVLSACSEAGADAPGAPVQVRGIDVVGPTDRPPQIDVQTPLKLDKTIIRTLVKGTGPAVTLDKVFVIQLTIVNGRTGDTAVSTYDEGRTPMAVTDSDSTLFPVLERALVGQPQGSRVLVAATPEDAYGDAGAPQYDIKPGDPLVLVADVIAVPSTTVLERPEGAVLIPPANVPQVAELDGEPTGIIFGIGDKVSPRPKDLVVIPLVQGSGEVVGPRDLVTLDYLGQTWGSAEQFANTYATGPVTVALGADRVITAWERALTGQRLGSRVLVLTPPDLAFAATGNPPGIPGNAALAYVIDILGVS